MRGVVFDPNPYIIQIRCYDKSYMFMNAHPRPRCKWLWERNISQSTKHFLSVSHAEDFLHAERVENSIKIEIIRHPLFQNIVTLRDM